MALEVYQWTLSGTLSGQFVQTVQHVLVDIAVPVNPYATAHAIATEMVSAGNLIEQFMDICPEDYLATSLRVRKVSGTGGPTTIFLAGSFAVAAGQRAGSISSAQVNPVLILIGTNLPDKTGRIFIPGVSEDDIEDMALSGSLLTAMGVFIAAYIVDQPITGATFTGAIFRRTLDVGDPILQGYVSPLIGTQRRRLRPV